MAPDYVFVHESRLKEFIEMAQLELKKMYGERPTGSDDMGKMINHFHFDRVNKLIEGAGGTVICGGKSNREAKYIEPTLILKPDLDSSLMKEEIFGPVMPIMPFRDIREVIKYINDRDKPLAVYYFGASNGPNSRLLCSETSSGAFITNEVIN